MLRRRCVGLGTSTGTLEVRGCGGAFSGATMSMQERQTVGALAASQQREAVTMHKQGPTCNSGAMRCVWEAGHSDQHWPGWATMREGSRYRLRERMVAAACRCALRSEAHPAARWTHRLGEARCMHSVPAGLPQVQRSGRLTNGATTRCKQLFWQ